MQRVPGVGRCAQGWDQEFLRTLAASSRSRARSTLGTDEQICKNGGNGAGEIREWIAALAAAHAAGAPSIDVDHYEAGHAASA